MMDSLLTQDHARMVENPKKYEEERVEDNMVQHSRDIYKKTPEEHLLSKSFKRKLRKGFIPYWNRAVDFFIWKNYYDQLLTLFKISYDSFNNVSLMLISKFKYLLRHLPDNLEIYESQAILFFLSFTVQGLLVKTIL